MRHLAECPDPEPNTAVGELVEGADRDQIPIDNEVASIDQPIRDADHEQKRTDQRHIPALRHFVADAEQVERPAREEQEDDAEHDVVHRGYEEQTAIPPFA